MSDQRLACGNCGAQLAPEAAWCGQCLMPVQQQQGLGPQSPMQPGAATQPAGLVDPRRPEHKDVASPEYSRWKGGPESFGPAGRIIMTSLLLMGLFVGYFFFQGGMVSFGGFALPLLGSIIMYGLLAAFIGAWALKSIWKRARVK
jgi:hypothetical protein